MNSCDPNRDFYHTDATGKQDACKTSPAVMPVTTRGEPPLIEREYLCCACGDERKGEPSFVCDNCLIQAVECERIRNERLDEHEDVERLNEGDGAMRSVIALEMLRNPEKPIRSIIDEATGREW